MMGSQRSAVAVGFVGLAFALAAGAQGRDEGAAQRLMLQAQRFEEQNDVDGALDEYRILVSEFPESSLAPRALLQSARLRANRGATQAAFDTAQELIDSYGRDPAAASGWVLQGEIRYSTAGSIADLEDAHSFLRRVPLLFPSRSYPRLEARAEARVRGAELSTLLGTDEEAAASFLEAIEDEPPSPWTARARIGLATVWLRQKEWVAAAEVLQRVVSGGGQSDEPYLQAAAARARRRLTLLHRLHLRSRASQPMWTKSRPLPLNGVALKKLTGVAVEEDGRLLVVDGGSGVAAVVSPQGTVEARGTYRNGGRPSFSFDRKPQLPIGDGVQELGGGRESFTLGGEKPKPLNKIEMAQRGVFQGWTLVDREAGTVSFDRRGRPQEIASGDISEAADLARDSLGQLYAIDRRQKGIVVLGLDGRRLRRISGNWRRPVALDIDPLGHLYVLDRGSSTITVMGPDGTQLATLGPQLPGGQELRSPEDLAVDGAGRLFIADSKSSALLLVE